MKTDGQRRERDEGTQTLIQDADVIGNLILPLSFAIDKLLLILLLDTEITVVWETFILAH